MGDGNGNGGTNTQDPFLIVQIDSSPSSSSYGVVGTVELIPRSPGPRPPSETKTRETCIDIEKAENLEYIENNPKLKLSLADWEKGFRESNEIFERKLSRSLIAKNEIYQFIGFFSVFQGVVLTALAQSTKLDCRIWWVPFTLSLLVAGGTFQGLFQKFRDLERWKKAAAEEKVNSQFLKLRIDELKNSGKKFDFSKEVVVPKAQKTRHQKPITYLVVCLIIGFSGIILYACYAIPCKSVKDGQTG